jgi:tetratricopeptide (TPR) repeat protein
MILYCSKCGTKNREDAQSCGACGEEIECPGGEEPVKSQQVLIHDRYELLSPGKCSAMTGFLEARDVRTGDRVSIRKMLSGRQEEQEHEAGRFMEEAGLLMSLHHRGLPGVIDFFIEKDKDTGKVAYFLVMTPVDGRELATIIDERGGNPFPLDEVMKYAAQILEILDYLHTREPPVLYRALNPRTIMIHDDRVVLPDCGIVRVSAAHQKGGAIGTYGYTSMEQCRGTSDPRSDLYSLGAILHYLLTASNPEDPSHTPFRFEPVGSINAGVPEDIAKIIMSMLSNSIDERPQSARRILDMLSRPALRDDNSVEALIGRGESLREQGLRQEALKCFSEATRIAPGNAQVWQKKGHFHASIGLRHEALKCYDKAIAIDPGCAIVWNDKGLCLDSSGLGKDALSCYDRAIAIDPGYVMAWYNKGSTLERLYRFKDALQCFDRVILLDPGFARAWHNQGACLQKMGRAADAQKSFAKARSLDPSL